MKLKSFGCSFVFGSDLDDAGNSYSSATWPGLIAQDLGLEYECHAWPGRGNFKIMCDIIREVSRSDPAIFVINWTWNDRFDYIDGDERWTTLLPAERNEIEKFYYKNLHSQFHDMMRSASFIFSAIKFLESKDIPFLMTYMDYTLLEEVNPNWHDPRYLTVLQSQIKDYLNTFDGKNFLDWSRDQGFAVSDKWHPLAQAHRAAADFWMPSVQRLIRS